MKSVNWSALAGILLILGVVPAISPADVVLERAALGSIYLGGVAPSTLARAGRVVGKPAAIAQLDRMFARPRRRDR